MTPQVFIGLGGVHKEESPRARLIGRYFNFFLVFISILLLMQWNLQKLGVLKLETEQNISWVIWSFFVVELLVLLPLVENKFRYLKQNWLSLVIITIGFPPILHSSHLVVLVRLLRPILAIILFVPWIDFMHGSLKDNRLLTTLVTVFVVVIVSGFIISGIDPAINTPWDGFWWSWVTMSTVGFGDVVPVSLAGRLFASLLILTGLLFFAILTANFSSMFLRRDVGEIKKQNEELVIILKELDAMHQTDEVVKEELLMVANRLAELEKKLK